MRRDTILLDINETVLDLSSLKPKFKAVFGDEAPCVPAEVLTFGYKPPVTTVMTLLLAVLSMYLQGIISPENI